MKKNIYLVVVTIIVVFIISLLIFGCNKNDNPVTPNSNNGIYYHLDSITFFSNSTHSQQFNVDFKSGYDTVQIILKYRCINMPAGSSADLLFNYNNRTLTMFSYITTNYQTKNISIKNIEGLQSIILHCAFYGLEGNVFIQDLTIKSIP